MLRRLHRPSEPTAAVQQTAPAWREAGVALMAVVMITFLFVVVVAVLAVAAMGEATLSADQVRGQQALAVAEAGAYRALADLRRRLSVDLDHQLARSSTAAGEIRAICTGVAGRRPIEIIERFAWPAALGATDWTRPTGDPETARLVIGAPSAPVRVTDTATGGTVGTFHAMVLVRPSGSPATCRFGTDLPEVEVMWFDFAIRSVGRAGTAARAVCLRSPSADRCPDWFSAAGRWEGSQAISGGAVSGWPVMLEAVSGDSHAPGRAYAAVRDPRRGTVFADGDPLYDRPHWEEVTGL